MEITPKITLSLMKENLGLPPKLLLKKLHQTTALIAIKTSSQPSACFEDGVDELYIWKTQNVLQKEHIFPFIAKLQFNLQPTMERQQKMLNIYPNSTCRLCMKNEETIQHLLLCEFHSKYQEFETPIINTILNTQGLRPLQKRRIHDQIDKTLILDLVLGRLTPRKKLTQLLEMIEIEPKFFPEIHSEVCKKLATLIHEQIVVNLYLGFP